MNFNMLPLWLTVEFFMSTSLFVCQQASGSVVVAPSSTPSSYSTWAAMLQGFPWSHCNSSMSSPYMLSYMGNATSATKGPQYITLFFNISALTVDYAPSALTKLVFPINNKAQGFVYNIKLSYSNLTYSLSQSYDTYGPTKIDLKITSFPAIPYGTIAQSPEGVYLSMDVPAALGIFIFKAPFFAAYATATSGRVMQQCPVCKIVLPDSLIDY